MLMKVKSQTGKIVVGISMLALLSGSLVLAHVTPNDRTFADGQKAKVEGVIVSRDGNLLKLRGDDDAIGTVDLTDTTKIQMKHGMFGMSKASMDVTKLVPGLHVEAQGKGNSKGQLVAEKVIFDPNSMKASRQIDTRVSPLEARAGTLEGRAGALEGRAGQMETRQGSLEDQEHQTQQQVGQVKNSADQANQGVSSVNQRVTNLDNYAEKETETIHFAINKWTITDEDKKKLDDLAQKALAEKGYVVEVLGFADTTGKADKNQILSEHRANAVIQYLEQNGNIPVHRILAPAGMGTSHATASNDTKEGREQNRRVEVKVLVNQGVVASNPAPTGQTVR